MFDRTHTLPLVSPPTAITLAVSSPAVVLTGELTSVEPRGRTVT